ncbi:MAG: oligoendopeptidase F [Lachnospiraceae bacterium]|nr:oligoendopeptidase F [Lachnospiraceae bacterium]
MKTITIPERKDVPEEFTWDLTPIFADDDAWKRAFDAAGAYPDKLKAFEGRLGESAQTLLAFERINDEIGLEMGRIHGYASLKSDQDTGNSLYQNMRGMAVGLSVRIGGAGAFARPELLSLPEETLERFMKEEPALEEYRRSLEQLRRRRAHFLSPEGEELLAEAGEMAGGADHIGSTLRNADLTFPSVTDSEGRSWPLTNGSFVTLLESSDRELRRRAFDAYYGRMGELKNTIAATLDAQMKQLRFFAKARKYGSTLEAALDRTEVPEAVYGSLIDAVHANLDKMYRYVALRKRCLGVEELQMYDVYVPLVPEAGTEISFEQAKAAVLEALAVLGEDYLAILRKGFSERWIDVYENRGKRGGAYSSGGARPHPYVLLNHKDNLDSQFTLAHEMGHALHSWYSVQHQPVSTSRYVIFVAEVASTCNEVLLMRHLLAKTSERGERAALINYFLDKFKGTLYRQTMFAEFEREMGRLSEAGQTLTADLLSEKFRALNALYFGPEMVSDGRIALEWTRIPHFFYNYYVFQYATGFSAAVALANRILKEGDPAVRDYKRFLSAGSSQDPISLLKIAGVDMSTPGPVASALALFDELIGEMEALQP